MKKVSRLALCGLVCMLLSAFLAMPFSGQALTINNLLKNGGFEEDLTNGWVYASDQHEGFSIQTEAEGVSEGEASLYYDGTAAQWAGIYQDVEVQPNKYYKFNYRTKLLGGRMQAYVCMLNEDGTEGDRLQEMYSRQDGGVNEDYGDWYSDGLQMINSGDNTKLRIVLLAADGDNEPKKTKGYIDDVQFYECDSLGLPVGGETGSSEPDPESSADESAPADESATGDASGNTPSSTAGNSSASEQQDGGVQPAVIIGIVAAVVVIAAVVIVIVVKKKKK